VLDFLDALEKDQDKFSNNIKAFEEYYFDKKPSLSNNYVKRLLFGDGYKQRGLFQHIRDLDPSSISANNLICFFSRLLDYRRNTHIDIFKMIFCSCDLKYLKELHLD
jgi:hypothetical protein